MELSDLKWHLVPSHGTAPSARWGHTSLVFEGAMYVFGGFGPSSCLDDINMFDLRTMMWSKLETRGPKPSPRYDHAAFIYNRSMCVVGGRQQGVIFPLTVVYSLDLDTLVWEEIETVPTRSSKMPLPRAGMAHVLHGDLFFVFGGFSSKYKYMNDTFFLDMVSREWHKCRCPSKQHSFRISKAAGVSLIVRDSVAYLWGGYTGKPSFSCNLYTFDLERLCWTSVPKSSVAPPPGRSGHSAITWPSSSDCMIVFGGCGPGLFSDVYMLDIASCEWITVLPSSESQPSGRFRHTAVAVHDPKFGTGMLVFGGCGSRKVYSDMYLLGRLEERSKPELDTAAVERAVRRLQVKVECGLDDDMSVEDVGWAESILDVIDPLLAVLDVADLDRLEMRIQKEKSRRIAQRQKVQSVSLPEPLDTGEGLDSDLQIMAIEREDGNDGQ
eukprot:TRINITY_DN30902_c0_g1_i1.p1 TRINITY_DN30902_c0_g1~~TRINITY_DN30902_c0_g1_i1.p1  ORF type:complete len:439 (-),score=88.81 TRINITY_DN30902_c0_g1_i1:169-1485(-)